MARMGHSDRVATLVISQLVFEVLAKTAWIRANAQLSL
jgi:hypothetical protein